MNEGAAGATTSPPFFETCATASAAVPTKKSMPSIRLVANGEDIVKPQDFTLHRRIVTSLNRYTVAAAIR
jgi:hypothetical protein